MKNGKCFPIRHFLQSYMYKFVFNVMMTFSKIIILDYSVFKEQKIFFALIEIATDLSSLRDSTGGLFWFDNGFKVIFHFSFFIFHSNFRSAKIGGRAWNRTRDLVLIRDAL